MAYRNDWVSLIRQLAPRYGVDPRAALAVASREGLSGGVGDGGHAFGPFQLNDAGGVITGRAGNRRAFAESPGGIAWALQQIAGVAKGQHGAQAVNSIVSRFERPANPGGEISGALAALNQFGGTGAGSVSQQPAAAASPSVATGPAPDIRTALAQQLASGRPLDLLGLALQAKRSAPQRPSPVAAAAAGPSGQSAAGFPRMSQHAGRVPGYADLATAPQADATHVDTRLLGGLEALAEALHKHITIISGYRSPAYSAKVGGYSTDPHTRGVAVDAYIGGTPVGSYPGAYKWLTAHGYESGATPGFYRGKTDPEHVQIPGSGVNKTIHARRTLGR